MIAVWQAVICAWVAGSIGFVLGAWWCSLFDREQREIEEAAARQARIAGSRPR